MTPVLTLMTPAARFSNHLENHVRFRPVYPDAVTRWFLSENLLNHKTCIVEVGAGNGIFMELLGKAGYTVIGIEPDERKRILVRQRPDIGITADIRSGMAEATGLEDGFVDLLLVAECFHSFDPVMARREWNRILKPGATIVLAWNRPRKDSNFMQQYISMVSEYTGEPEIRNIPNETIISDLFDGNFKKVSHDNDQLLNFDALKSQLLSIPGIPIPGHDQYETLIASLVKLFVTYNKNGFVGMNYETVVYCRES